jgi:hypothetical protein
VAELVAGLLAAVDGFSATPWRIVTGFFAATFLRAVLVLRSLLMMSLAISQPQPSIAVDNSQRTLLGWRWPTLSFLVKMINFKGRHFEQDIILRCIRRQSAIDNWKR